MSSLFSSNGYFTPTQLKTLEAFLDNVTVGQTVSAGDRERLAKVVIALAQSHLDTDAELSRLLKAASCVLLDSGRFLRPPPGSHHFQPLSHSAAKLPPPPKVETFGKCVVELVSRPTPAATTDTLKLPRRVSS
jgi:hypothetical protein